MRFRALPSSKAGDMLLREGGLSDWLRLVRGEFLESPGLALTKAQAQRFWGLDAGTCDALIDELVRAGFLRRTRSDRYARADTHRRSRAHDLP